MGNIDFETAEVAVKPIPQDKEGETQVKEYENVYGDMMPYEKLVPLEEDLAWASYCTFFLGQKIYT